VIDITLVSYACCVCTHWSSSALKLMMRASKYDIEEQTHCSANVIWLFNVAISQAVV